MALVAFVLLSIFYSEFNNTSAKECEFPHIVFLYIEKERGNFSCGGSLIDETHIVTASHCVDGDIKSVYALFGSLNMRRMTDIIPVSTYAQHPGFTQARAAVLKDVAVLKLSRPVKFTKCRKPIRLVKPNEKVSSDCVIAGWGKTDFYSRPSDWLRRADVPIMPLISCARMVPGITTQHVCAGTAKYDGKSACKVDYGGPLMCQSKEDGETVLVGLVSYGWTCREGLGVYTSVAYFNQWIKAAIKHI